MAQTSVAQFASELKVPPSLLLEQLRAAGVQKRVPEDSLTEQDKSRLLDYLRKAHGSAEAKNKITLTRKQTSEIKKSDASGKARTIQVEVRKKRVFVKRDPNELAAAAAAAEPPPPPLAAAPTPAAAAPRAPALDPRELALREQEQKRQQALSDIQAAELREKQEREKRETLQREAQRAAQAQAPAAQAPAPGPAKEGTLHAPKTGEAKPADRKAKKIKTTVLRDDGVRRRAMKTRGDMGGGVAGWHGRGGSRHGRGGSVQASGEPALAQPLEPVVREIAVPETITV
ncbi:MAG: translation initiation factor IF-2, partial [Betaproteobacteria bacterium]|nr:translation initiation factor IF-2 [Betaproteobacteria bacterium]